MAGFFKKKAAVDQDAVSLFVRTNSDTATEGNIEALADWAENAPEKLDDFELLSEAWDLTGELEPDPSLFLDEGADREPWWLAFQNFFLESWVRPVGAVAAILMMAVMGFLTLQDAPAPNPSYATVRGVTKTVQLADGSAVYLNGLSRLEVNFSDDERRIDMLEGEVYFDVSSDKKRAFVVAVADAEVRALGTAFDIDAGADALTVIVTEGTVGISRGTAYGRYSAGSKIVIPNDAIGVEDFMITKLVLTDFEQAVTWRQGVLNFTGESLSVALERINRQSEKRIVLGDPSLGSLQIFGSFRQDNVQGFLTALQTLYGVRVVESHHRIALYPARAEKAKNEDGGA